LPAYVDDNWGAAGQLQVIKNLYWYWDLWLH
jgi:hypothetical protein